MTPGAVERSLLFGCLIAALLWFLMFSPWTSSMVNFWGVMAGAAGILAGYSLQQNRNRLRELFVFRRRWIFIGLISAAGLYLVFFAGDRVSSLLFEFAVSEVEGIYGTRTQASPVVIGLLLLVLIGPAEEIFWRGFVQQRLSERLGLWKGYFAATMIYAGVHIWAFNLMLFLAALVCGLFWGWMFLYYRSVWPGLISHGIWDLTIFVLLPLAG